jgi:hypothetical protein
MTGNLRYPTADGRVLQESDRKGDRIRFSDGHQYEVTTTEGNPLVFDATCTTCKDVASAAKAWARDPMAFAQGCAACEGTGVDETIPLRMIGLGSELRDLTGSHHGTFVIARFMKSFIRDRDGFVYYPDDGGECWALVSEIGDSFEVVRAIPPAHTGGTP